MKSFKKRFYPCFRPSASIEQGYGSSYHFSMKDILKKFNLNDEECRLEEKGGERFIKLMSQKTPKQ